MQPFIHLGSVTKKIRPENDSLHCNTKKTLHIYKWWTADNTFKYKVQTSQSSFFLNFLSLHSTFSHFFFTLDRRLKVLRNGRTATVFALNCAKRCQPSWYLWPTNAKITTIKKAFIFKFGKLVFLSLFQNSSASSFLYVSARKPAGYIEYPIAPLCVPPLGTPFGPCCPLAPLPCPCMCWPERNFINKTGLKFKQNKQQINSEVSLTSGRVIMSNRKHRCSKKII